MTKTVLLNKTDHQDLRVNTGHSAALGDNVNTCVTFVAELRTLQAHYPVFFQKDARTGEFLPMVLLGFENGENLFLTEKGWDAPYVPALIKRQPFAIGTQTGPEGDEQRRVIHIDMDNPRVNKKEGEPLFLEFGGNSPYLTHIADLLETIHQGMTENKGFVEALLQQELIESFALNIELANGSTHQLVGFYTINEERLYQLDKDALHRLNEKGYLQGAYMMLASQSQLSALIARKNQQLAG